MSMHKLYADNEALNEALKKHKLPHDAPSQLADAFRSGWLAKEAGEPSNHLLPGWVAIPLEPTVAQWVYAQGTLLDVGWDSITCFSARIQTLISITRKQWKDALAAPTPDGKEPCPKCGAPCHTTVNPRGGDYGWGTTDQERTVYSYKGKA